MAIIFSNNASSNLQDVFTSESNTITISKEDIGSFPYTTEEDDNYFFVVVQSKDAFEICKCVEVNLKNGTLTVERAKEGTTAALFNKGSLVEHRLTAGSFKELAKIASDSFSHALSDVSKIGQADSTNYGHVKFVDNIDFNNFTDIDPKSESGLVVSPDIFSRYAQELRDFVNGPNAKQLLTTSGTWIAPFTCKYRITIVGGGGTGGVSGGIPTGVFFTSYTQTGENHGHWSYITACGMAASSSNYQILHKVCTTGGGGGGSAAETKSLTQAFVKGTGVPITVGGVASPTMFGTLLTASGGSNGQNGTRGTVWVRRQLPTKPHSNYCYMGYAVTGAHSFSGSHTGYSLCKCLDASAGVGGASGQHLSGVPPAAGAAGVCHVRIVAGSSDQYCSGVTWSVPRPAGGKGGISTFSQSVLPNTQYGNGGSGTSGNNAWGYVAGAWCTYNGGMEAGTPAQPGAIYIEAIID